MNNKVAYEEIEEVLVYPGFEREEMYNTHI